MHHASPASPIDFDRLLVRGATIDELLSDEFETLPGQKGDTDQAARRLAAWCRNCASGDWVLFARRLERDRLSFEQVLSRLASVRRRTAAPTPPWIADARWIEEAFRAPICEKSDIGMPGAAEPLPFEHLSLPVIEQAERRLWSGLNERVAANLTDTAHSSLREALLERLSELCTPVLYERFAAALKAAPAESPDRAPGVGDSHYATFIADMRDTGTRRLFDEKPVLLRLLAVVVRQWIDTTGEMLARLEADLPAIRREIPGCGVASRLTRVKTGLSDPHHGGRSVEILTFDGGGRVVYKPKDLRLDAEWHALVERLNSAEPPIDLKAVKTLRREGYGWTEFIDHTECADRQGFARFFRRAGAWLALFHAFAATDMHEENMIATGDHPVPIDLEMILQASAPEHESETPESRALDLASRKIGESVTMTGLLPAYGRSPENKVFELGGLNAGRRDGTVVQWKHVNSDAMSWSRVKTDDEDLPNLPRFEAEDARLGDHIDDLVAGFETYANFLLHRRDDLAANGLLDGFSGLPVRKVVRPTRFYYLLLQRLKDHRTMGDGAAWSTQADFIARLADWDKASDPIWPLQRAERAALLELNVPHFVSLSDAVEIRAAAGPSTRTEAVPGIERARARVADMDGREIAWQSEVIRQSTSFVSGTAARTAADAGSMRSLPADAPLAPTAEAFRAEAGAIAAVISEHALRSGPGAAWIGLDWLGDSEVAQLSALGHDLYNGATGIAVFLAAYAHQTGDAAAGRLALAGLSALRTKLRGSGAARMARSLGIGGASGLGSIVYGLTLVSEFTGSDEVLSDAHVAARLFSDDLIAADRALDIIGGSAGAILGLLRLHATTGERDVLQRATKCGEHLLGQRRVGSHGCRSWIGQGMGPRPLNGMSHGAAGFAHALALLSTVTGREDFASAARECIAFENANYDDAHGNWPDLRDAVQVHWPCQWCHGAVGIGLARGAMLNRGTVEAGALRADVERALEGGVRNWPNPVDTLCCGTLGSIEFLFEAGRLLQRTDLRDLALRRLMAVLQAAASNGDYRWRAGSRRFNLGLFQGVAGVGYTLLRRVDGSLPNVIIWE